MRDKKFEQKDWINNSRIIVQEKNKSLIFTISDYRAASTFTMTTKEWEIRKNEISKTIMTKSKLEYQDWGNNSRLIISLKDAHIKLKISNYRAANTFMLPVSEWNKFLQKVDLIVH